ncbi:uncharacterized protein BCR38DRAFT_483149 [Pseudomassariella vexata]|uniref:Uncharacterized protein n=1 Tax=Pseudomassariella vexata TaxID=1141098 RepID=A0A1Y2E891_9PEZI|nr:uncharacterized protein BCR38DRAFT_483149 [Pseudomassariella vexata]ORY67534.1 hypothetical protein BCR38DRAFT_483149 [Pseudomassariella vexata]
MTWRNVFRFRTTKRLRVVPSSHCKASGIDDIGERTHLLNSDQTYDDRDFPYDPKASPTDVPLIQEAGQELFQIYRIFHHVTPQILRTYRLRSILCFLLALSIVISQILFQALAIPWINANSTSYMALSAVIGVPEILVHIVDLVWVPITNDLDAFFHDKLREWPGIHRKENKTVRDALRKCENVDDIIHLTITKIFIVIFSLCQAFWHRLGGWTVLGSLGVILANWAWRWCLGQCAAIRDNVDKRVERYIAFNYGTEEKYEKAWEEYSKSKFERGRSDFARSFTWELVLFLAIFFLTPEGTQLAIYAKMLKDVYSLDDHLDKITKSSVPSWTLMKACYEFDLSRKLEYKGDEEMNRKMSRELPFAWDEEMGDKRDWKRHFISGGSP